MPGPKDEPIIICVMNPIQDVTKSSLTNTNTNTNDYNYNKF